MAIGCALGFSFQSGASATSRAARLRADGARVGAAGQTSNFAAEPGATVAADPNEMPFYAQPYDGRGSEGPSSKLQDGQQQLDKEVADDFDLNATITRVRARGVSGSFNSPPPTYYGVYVRFYDGAGGMPGALQAEHYLPQGSPGVVYNAARPTTFDITLPTPFNANGRHFLSVQPVFGGAESWAVLSSGYQNVRGSILVKRDRLAGGAWTVAGIAGYQHDMAFELFGTLLSAPRIDAMSPNPVPRSGLVRITGNYFGPSPDSSRLTIDGKQPQYIPYWSDNLIIAYVPETSALGDVPVSITSSGKTGAGTLNVTTRPTAGRIRWQFTVAAGHVPRRSAVGPDGTVYVNDVLGRLYALTPDGGLKWVFQAGFVAASGPVSVGADGTIYVGGLVPKNPATTCEADQYTVNVEGIFALRPDGTQKWLFDKTCDSLLSGPNVGPDGNIHAVTDSTGIGAFALKPDGTLAHAPTGRFGVDGEQGTEIVFGPTAPGQAPTQKYFQYESGGLFGYTLDGQRVFLYPTNAVGITQPVVGQRTGTVYTMPDHQTAGRLFAVSPQGALRWVSPIRPISNLSIPDAPPSESAVYVVQDGAKLHRVNPADGSIVWTFNDNNEQLFDPIASPDDRLILMGGQANYGQPGFFEAVSKDGRQLWKQLLPDEPGLAPYGQVVPRYRARFTDDGQTAYIAAHASGSDYSGRPAYSFFYALDTSDNTAPINQPPTATIVSPLSNLNVPARTSLDFKVRAEDDAAVARVEFFYGRNGTRTHLGTDTTPDADGLYGMQFTPPAPGVYSLFAQVYDAAGLRGDSQSVTITASNQSPTISWINPANNATFVAPASITLTARAADSDGTVSIVHFNSSLLGDIGQDTTPDAEGNYQIVWSNPSQGTHELVAWATDNDGDRRAATINVTVKPVATPTPTPTPSPTPTGAPPVVSIISPADGASFAPGTSVAVTADASDSDGRVTRVEFLYEGSGNPIASDSTAPFVGQIRWPGPTALKLYAVAYDDAGNRTESARVLLYFEDPAGNLSITGRITHQQSSPSNPIYLPNALVKLGLNNQPLRATRTDANGYYTFAGLSRGGGYKVEPAELGYVFYPPAVFYSGLVESATRDFIAEGPLPAGPTPTPTPGASGLAWERFYNSPHNASDGGALLATDAQGNTYVAGTSDAGVGGDLNISLVKYGPDGTQLWEREYAGSGDGKDWATAVRLDSEGNVYVSGTTWGGAVYEYDVVTIKYAADGTRLWARTYNGPLGRWDTSAAMEIDNAGNVIVGGYSQAGDTSGRLYDEFLVIKYNPSGVAVWERRRSTDAKGDRLVALTVDSARNVYATGNAQVASTDGSTFEDLVTVKYAPDGTRLWSSRFNRAASTVPLPDPLPNNPASRARAGGAGLDPATGDLYVFGTSEFGATGLDYLLLKYDTATGELRWNRNWSGTRADSARAMAVDAQGNAYLTGESYDGDFESATSVRSADVATVKFAPGGDVLWERAYRGFPGKTDEGRRIALDAAGSAYVAFYSEGFFNADTGVVKYDADGAEQWVYRYDNPAHTSDQVSDLALDAAGNLYVAGSASVPNAAGAQTGDFVVFKLAPVSAALNAAPDVSANVQAAAKTGSSVTVAATATDRDGAVARVDFFDGTTQIGTDTAAPFSVEWSPADTGAHAITALATDDKGAARTSKTQIVTVGAAPQTYAVAGRLTANGAPLAGVAVTLSGSQSGATTTDASGNYSFANLPAGGNYTVTPALASYTFNPSSATFNNLAASQVADFVGVPTEVTISGRVRDANGNGIDGATISLSGERSESVHTDANGQYVLRNILSVASYTVTPSKPGFTFNPSHRVFANPATDQAADFVAVLDTAILQFGASGFTESEGGGRVTLTVTRTGNTAGTSTVAYATTDNPAAVRCDDNSTMSGAAFARCDYATSIDRITFAPGETSASFTIPLVDDSHTEHGESFEVVLSDPSGAALGGQPVARVTITDNDSANVPNAPNAIDNNEFFVRMHYLDFLNREPDAEGMAAWARVLNNCAPGDTECDRNTVSSAFFRSQEFQLKGFYVYRFYKVALGRLPLYAEITPDMRSVSGQTEEEVYRKRAEFAEVFAARPAFRAQYDALSDQAFIDTLLNRYNLTSITTHDPAEPEAARKLSFTGAQLLNLLSARTLSRAQVLRAIVQSDEVSAVEYNGAFVAMQYFGYLRRDPDADGFRAWLAVLDANPEDYRTMVRGFESSVEYRLRFGQP
ncbi:MAG TPA: Ig-like domain-containing protein [Pyrinomonadaceae bacterium]